jgi:hypothetical protein
VAVSVNGTALGVITIDGRATPHRVALPPDATAACCVIGFTDAAPLVTPASFGIGDDRRMLGFHLDSITVEPR